MCCSHFALVVIVLVVCALLLCISTNRHRLEYIQGNVSFSITLTTFCAYIAIIQQATRVEIDEDMDFANYTNFIFWLAERCRKCN